MRAQARISNIFKNLPTDPHQRLLALWLIEQSEDDRAIIEAEALSIAAKIPGMGPIAALQLLFCLGRWLTANHITGDCLHANKNQSV